jgi:hypothetical protein
MSSLAFFLVTDNKARLFVNLTWNSEAKCQLRNSRIPRFELMWYSQILRFLKIVLFYRINIYMS